MELGRANFPLKRMTMKRTITIEIETVHHKAIIDSILHYWYLAQSAMKKLAPDLKSTVTVSGE